MKSAAPRNDTAPKPLEVADCNLQSSPNSNEGRSRNSLNSQSEGEVADCNLQCSPNSNEGRSRNSLNSQSEGEVADCNLQSSATLNAATYKSTLDLQSKHDIAILILLLPVLVLPAKLN